MLKRKISMILAAGMILAVILTGCGTAEKSPDVSSENVSDGDDTKSDSESGYSIGVVYCTLAEEFTVDIQSGINEACKKNGITVNEINFDTDLSKGSDAIENFVNSGMDAIIVWPMDGEAFIGAVDNAAEKGIPIVTIDCNVETDSVNCFITSDNVQGGELSAQYVLDTLGDEGGNILVITTTPGLTSLDERLQGYSNILKNAGDNINVYEQMDPLTGGREGFATTVENALTAHPDTDIILANCGDAALGALSVVEMYPEKYKDIKIVGFDATDEQLTAMQEGRQIIASVAQFPKMMGRLGVENALNLIEGNTVDKEQDIEVGLVTVDNIDTFEKKE